MNIEKRLKMNIKSCNNRLIISSVNSTKQKQTKLTHNQENQFNQNTINMVSAYPMSASSRNAPTRFDRGLILVGIYIYFFWQPIYFDPKAQKNKFAF